MKLQSSYNNKSAEKYQMALCDKLMPKKPEPGKTKKDEGQKPLGREPGTTEAVVAFSPFIVMHPADSVLN